MKNSTIKIITYAVILLVAVLAIGFAVFITNGFTEKPKSFYVEINGDKVAYKLINAEYDDSTARISTEKLNKILNDN